MQKSNLPLVSVVIPTLNRPDYIKETLISVLNQTYKNLEIILSDNGSNYDVKDYLNNFFSNDNRLIYRKNLNTIKPALHFNQCIEFSTGKYFIIICDDDYISPNFIELMVNEFEVNSKLTLGLSKNIQIDEYSKVIKENEVVSWKFKNGGLYLKNWLSGDELIPVASYISLFANRELLLNSGGFPDFLDASHSDNAAAINLALRGDVLFIKEATFSYRVYKQSFGLKLSYKSLSIACSEFVNYFNNNIFLISNFTQTERLSIIKGVKNLAFKTYINRLISNYNLKGINFIKALFSYKYSLYDITLIYIIIIKYIKRSL